MSATQGLARESQLVASIQTFYPLLLPKAVKSLKNVHCGVCTSREGPLSPCTTTVELSNHREGFVHSRFLHVGGSHKARFFFGRLVEETCEGD